MRGFFFRQQADADAAGVTRTARGGLHHADLAAADQRQAGTGQRQRQPVGHGLLLGCGFARADDGNGLCQPQRSLLAAGETV